MKNLFDLNVLVGENIIVIQPYVIVSKGSAHLSMAIEYDVMQLEEFSRQNIVDTIRRIRKVTNLTPIKEVNYDYKKVYDNIAQEFGAKDWIELVRSNEKVVIVSLSRNARRKYSYGISKPGYEKGTRCHISISQDELPSGTKDDEAIDKFMNLLETGINQV